MTVETCESAGEHLPGQDHRWQECPTYHDEERRDVVEGHPYPCPDCRQGKHGACVGASWDPELDLPAACSCWEANHEGADR